MKNPTLPNFKATSQIIPITPNPGGNWRVKKGSVDQGLVTWTCSADCYIWIFFPPQRNPIVKGDPFGRKKVALELKGKGRYPYCLLIQDANGEFHHCDLNSPPDMDIQ